MVEIIGNPKYKKVYISGGITGIEDGNKKAFKEAELKLIENGFDAINPHELHTEEQIKTFSWSDFMRSDIKALCDCDFVAVLEGWQNSKGSNIEVGIARNLGMPIVNINDLKEFF